MTERCDPRMLRSMRGKALPLVLTAPEVAAIVSQLEHVPCSVRQVRYLLADLRPPAAARPLREPRLYGPADVGLMRLAVRLEAQGVSACRCGAWVWWSRMARPTFAAPGAIAQTSR